MPKYTVVEGDSAARIAAKVYSDPRLYREALSQGYIGKVRPGQVLNLPSEATLRAGSGRQLGTPKTPSTPKVPTRFADPPLTPRVTQPVVPTEVVNPELRAAQRFGEARPATTSVTSPELSVATRFRDFRRATAPVVSPELRAAERFRKPADFFEARTGKAAISKEVLFDPASVGGVGTPTELRHGQRNVRGEFVGFGPSSAILRSPDMTTMEAGLAAARETAGILQQGIRPGFLTPFVAKELGLTERDLRELGYVKLANGNWSALEFGDIPRITSSGGGGGVGRPIMRGGRPSGRVTARRPFSSGFNTGLVNWRIGL